MVEIDDVTFNELQRRWPFPRSMHGRLIDQLRRDGAKTIAYDVQFTEPTQVEEDNALIDAIDRAKNVVLATTEVDEVGRSNVFGDEGIVMEVGARVGNASYSPDSGGVIRRMPYEVERLKSFSVVAAEAATGRRIRRSDLGGDDAWIDWHGPPGTMRRSRSRPRCEATRLPGSSATRSWSWARRRPPSRTCTPPPSPATSCSLGRKFRRSR